MMNRLLALALVAGAVTSAQALVLDDFVDGGRLDLVIPAAPGPVQAVTAASVPGSLRYTSIGLLGAAQGNAILDVSPAVAGGTFSVSTDSRAQSGAQLGYGWSGPATPAPLNFDMSGMPKLQLTFLFNDLPLDVKATLNGSIARTVSVPGGISSATLAELDFTGEAGISDVDTILIEFIAKPGADYTISHVEAVPEPASMLALGLGLAGLAARRRRSK